MTIIAKNTKLLKKARISIGIPSFNEEKDIGKVIEAIQKQKIFSDVVISEMIVVDGQSTDKTRTIVAKMMESDPRIKLLVQKERLGKIEAINLFIKKAKEDVLIMANSDNIPQKNCLQRVINPLAEPKVGLVGPQMVCLNSGIGFFAYINRLIWRLHHKISLVNPKMSSFVAFRKSEIKYIPKEAVIDEPALEAIVLAQGKKIAYCPQAKVYLKGAENFKDFVCQRRRNYFGYLMIKRLFPEYHPSTFKAENLIRALISEISFDMVDNFFLFFSIILELYCKFLAYYDYYFKNSNYQAWPAIKTSKGLNLK